MVNRVAPASPLTAARAGPTERGAPRDAPSRVAADRVEVSDSGRRLADRAAAAALATLDTNTYEIAGGDGAARPVLVAGQGKFDALWARDTSFAAWGALSAGRLAAVKGTLESLLAAQFEDGLIPRRLGSSATWVANLADALHVSRGRPSRFDRAERRGGFGGVAVDSNLLVAIAAGEYVERSADLGFARRALPGLARAMAWIAARLDQGLVTQTPFSDWKDMVNRGQVVMYNQALYVGALQSMARLAERVQRPNDAAVYRAGAEAAVARIQAAFWDESAGYFRDSETAPGFSPDGNLLAVLFGIATPEQGERIFRRCDALLQARGLLPASESLYRPEQVPMSMKLAGLTHYHDAMAWPWLTSLYALVAARAGHDKRAERALAAVAALVERDSGFYEIYENQPPVIVKRPLYRSEPGFSWSAGLFLRAYHELYGGDRGGAR